MRTNGRKDADQGIHLSEHEKYFELCALSTTGDLTDGEIELLHSHMAVCEECSTLFASYQGRTAEKMMAKLADTIQPIQEEDAGQAVFGATKARKHSFLQPSKNDQPPNRRLRKAHRGVHCGGKTSGMRRGQLFVGFWALLLPLPYSYLF